MRLEIGRSTVRAQADRAGARCDNPESGQNLVAEAKSQISAGR